MPQEMQVLDGVRIRVLESLLGKGAVKPSLSQLKARTGFHKATLLSSLRFLEKEGVLQGYGPKIDFRRMEHSLEATTLYQLDLSKKKLFSSFLEAVERDPHLYWFSGMLGSGNWNHLSRHLFPDIESYTRHFQAHYAERIPDLFDLMKDRQVFFTTLPLYKNRSRTQSILEIVKRKKGLV